MSKAITLSNSTQATSPDYPGLVQFLVGSLLESPQSLKVDCEWCNNNQRIWIRLAFEGEDKGRVFGRGGRNLQAIRTVLATAAATVGKSLYLDVYESESERPRRSPPNFDKPPLEEGENPPRQTPSPRFPVKTRPELG